jgi:hypothetical protein
MCGSDDEWKMKLGRNGLQGRGIGCAIPDRHAPQSSGGASICTCPASASHRGVSGRPRSPGSPRGPGQDPRGNTRLTRRAAKRRPRPSPVETRQDRGQDVRDTEADAVDRGRGPQHDPTHPGGSGAGGGIVGRAGALGGHQARRVTALFVNSLWGKPSLIREAVLSVRRAPRSIAERHPSRELKAALGAG